MKMSRTQNYEAVADWWAPRVKGENDIIKMLMERTGLPRETVERCMVGVRLDYLLMAIVPEKDEWEGNPE